MRRKFAFAFHFYASFGEAVGAVTILKEGKNVIGTNMLVKMCAKT